MVDFGEHRRLEPVAGLVDAGAADAQRGAPGLCVGDLRFQHRELRCAREGADVGLFAHRVAEPETAHGLNEGGHEGVVNALVHIDAFDRAAALAGVVHRTIGQRFGGRLQVGAVQVIAHIGRVFATEFELQLDEARTHRRRDARAGGVRAGEEHAIDGLRQQGRTHRTATDQRHEHIDRHARFMQQARDVKARERGEFRRLVEHRIARQQGRHEHIATDEIRVVPGRDVDHHAERVEADPLAHAAFVEHLLRCERGLGLGEEEVDPAQQAVELIA